MYKYPPSSLIIKLLSEEEYKEYLKDINFVNLLQTFEYGYSKSYTEKYKLYNILIFDTTNNKNIAILQLFLKDFLVAKIIRINRGPLFFNTYDDILKTSYLIEIINLATKIFSKNSFILFLIAPEMIKTQKTLSIFKKNNIFQRKNASWSSGFIRLNTNLDQILMSFDGKWRNSMRKAEKNNILIKKMNNDEININILLTKYENLKQKNNFESITPHLINELIKFNSKNWEFNLYFAYCESDINHSIAQLVTIKHYDTTIYLIGVSDETGKKLQVNSLLLWNAIKDSKINNSIYFDIGGLNSTTPIGISKFKAGLRAEMYELIGEFFILKFPIFFRS